MTDQIEDYIDYMLRIGRKESTMGSYRSVLRICIDLLGKAGMRTKAEEIGEGGADLATVKELMRHANINTTLSCYIDVKDREKERTLRKFSAEFGRVLNKNKCIT